MKLELLKSQFKSLIHVCIKSMKITSLLDIF
jgi:hypothetical protein